MKSVLILSLLSSVISYGVKPMPISKSYWKSSSFRKAFNGSYRINARTEPFVDTKERGLLVSIESLMAKGDRKSALKKLKSSSLSKSSAAVMYNLGNIAYELGDLKLAKKEYLRAIKKFPTFLRAHQNLAAVYSREGDYDKAFPILLEAVRLGSQDGSVMGLLGYCYQQKGDLTAALHAFRNAQLTDPNAIDWKVGEAYCHDSLGDYDKALNLYKTIIKVRPSELQYQLSLADLYQRAGKVEEAIVHLELLRRQKKLDFSNKVLLGGLHFSDGSRVIGAEVVREVLRSDAFKDARLAMNLVRLAMDSGEVALAREFYGMVKPGILEGVGSKRRYKRLEAKILILEGGDIEKITGILKGLIAGDPLDADSLFLLAQQEASVLGLNEEALLHYQQAYAGKGVMKRAALLERGKLLAHLKRYEESLTDLKGYRALLGDVDDKSLNQYILAVERQKESSEY